MFAIDIQSMTMNSNKLLDEGIIYLIQKDKLLLDKSSLLEDMSIINNESIQNSAKMTALERLIKYLSYLPKWDEELITYLGNRLFALKQA